MKSFFEINLTNKTEHKSSDLARIVEFCTPPGLKKEFKVIIKQNDNDDWDGTAWPDKRRIEVIIPTSKSFPQVLDINHELPGSYLRKVYLEDETEFLVWMLSHEIFHLSIADDPKIVIMRHAFQEFMECDEETLADFFGISILNKYRRTLF